MGIYLKPVKLLLFAIICITCIDICEGQNLDSVLLKLKDEKSDTGLINLYLKANSMVEETNPDSANYFLKKAKAVCKYQDFNSAITTQNSLSAYYATKISFAQGVASKSAGDLVMAYYHYSKALNLLMKILQSPNNRTNVELLKKDIAKCYNNLGIVVDDQGKYELAIWYYRKSLAIKKELGDKKGVSYTYNNIGLVYWELGKYDLAIDYFTKSINLKKNLSDKKGMANCYNNIAMVFDEQGQYIQAVENYSIALKTMEELNDRNGMGVLYTNLGVVFQNMNDSANAMKYYTKALAMMEITENKYGIAGCLNNLGPMYCAAGDFVKAKNHLYKALQICEELNDSRNIALSCVNIGNLFMLQKENLQAINYYQKARAIYNEIGDKQGLSHTLNQLAIGQLLQNNFAKAAEFGEQALEISKNIGALPIENDSYKILSKAFAGLKLFEKAYQAQLMFKTLSDSIYSEKVNKHMQVVEAKYQNEKKQREIEVLNKDKQIQETNIKKERTQKYAFLTGFSLMVILLMVILFGYRKIRKQKKQILENNKNLHNQNIKIAQQRDFIEHIHEELTDSIQYAKRIQSAMLPSQENIQLKLMQNTINGEHQVRDYFILYKPRDIVSGDFYYVEKRNKYLLFAVADCTGHGVPGAFMSMLGLSFLNEIVRKKDVTKPADALDYLREYVIDALQQKNSTNSLPGLKNLSLQDGMDIAFCAYNTETGELQFAGANNSVIAISKIGELKEIKGDKMPIGIYDKMIAFTNWQISIEPGTTIYLISDGYADQFGGPKGKKFMAKQLKELLISISQTAMDNQKTVLNSTIDSWMQTNTEGAINGSAQIDDITVMGIKF